MNAVHLNDFKYFYEPIWNTITIDEDLNVASQLIFKDLCYNDGYKNQFSLLACKLGVNQILDILIAYIEIMLANKDFPYYSDGSDKNSEVNNEIIKNVAKRSGQIELLTARVLRQLYWATFQNRIQTSAILYPRGSKYENIEDLRNSSVGILKLPKKIVEGTANIFGNLVDTVENTSSVIKYLPYMVVAALGVGIYLIVRNDKEIIKKIKV